MNRKRGNRWKLIAFVGGLAVLVVTARAFDLGERLALVRSWIESLGALGPAVFVALYVGAAVAMVPGIALTVGAGALFGSVWGTVYVSLASTLGAAGGFLIARYLARESVSGWLGNNPTFRHLDEMTEKHGATMVAITRLVPVFPYNLLNYGYGLTRVPLGTYLFWSWLCMLPATVVYVVGADALFTALRDGRVPWALLGALAVFIPATFLFVRMARGRLGEVGATDGEVQGSDDGSREVQAAVGIAEE
jgi:uncharacterized membrane protein YdjX (TVP38/TMEM64 family)